MGRWKDAAAEFRRAAELLPRSDKLELFVQWSTIQARPETPATKGEKAELARAAVASLKEDPDFAFANYVAGDLALLEDEIGRAHRLLSRAVKNDPELLDAARLLRIVERRTGSEPSSKRSSTKKVL